MGFAKPIEQYLFGNLLTEVQVIMYLKDIIRGNEDMKTEKYIRIITSFARMYGVAETLKDLPFRNQEETYLLFSAWAKEYMKEPDTDMVAFFEKKISEL